jgi:hypothetical protein
MLSVVAGYDSFNSRRSDQPPMQSVQCRVAWNQTSELLRYLGGGGYAVVLLFRIRIQQSVQLHGVSLNLGFPAAVRQLRECPICGL